MLTRRSFRALGVAVALIVILTFAADSVYSQCLASGDVDNSGQGLAVADYVYLNRFVNGQGPAPVNLYEADLNGDCAIDYADLDIFGCYFEHGLSCFPIFPVPTCCDPDTVRGACCDSLGECTIRTPANCMAIGGIYRGDGRSCTIGSPCKPCGDVDESGSFDISDPVWLIWCVFIGCDFLPIPQQAEVNCDGTIDISDVVYMILFIFGGGPAPCADCP